MFIHLIYNAQHASIIKVYLSSYCTIGLSWRRRLKDPLLLLWWQCGIQWNDFDVSNFRSEVIDLTLDPFAGFINFLKLKKNNNVTSVQET